MQAWLQDRGEAGERYCKIEASLRVLVAKLQRGRPVPSCECVAIGPGATLARDPQVLTGKNPAFPSRPFGASIRA